jgi:hypothetical protein
MLKKVKSFNNGLKTVVSSTVITAALACFSTPLSAAVTLNVENSLLIGASGVNVSGVEYNVEFLDGSYNQALGTTPITFTSADSALVASQALLDQVFVNSDLYGNFDDILSGSTYFFTRGCTSFLVCSAMTPFGFHQTEDTLSYGVNVAVARNRYYSPDGGTYLSDDIVYMTGPIDVDSLGPGSFIWARWSLRPVAEIPEPSTYAMLGIGLLGVIWMRHRRKDEA